MEERKEDLTFTGNWYIDAGIVGFIKVLNWMYGWELEEVEKKVKEDPVRLYYGYFPLAYSFRYFFKDLVKELRKLERKKKELDEKMKKFEEKMKKFEEIKKDTLKEFEGEIKNKTDKNEIYESAWKFSVEAYKKLKGNEPSRLPFSSLFYQNFLMFNNSSKLGKQKEYLKNIICGDYESNKELLYIGRSVSKFLHSDKQFLNISYVPLCTRDINIFKKGYVFVYLVCVEHAFENFGEDLGNIFFYSPTLNFCYEVNKKLAIANKIYSKKNKNTLLRIIWRNIIDLLIEYKSLWSLEEMYIISYKEISRRNQALVNVEYIGIPKLQASILIDDEIRENLNRKIEIDKERKYWIVEEFIKNKPLYPLIFSYIKTNLSQENGVSEEKIDKYMCYYSLIVDAKLLGLRSEKEENEKLCIFSEKKETYKSLLKEIKKDVRETYFCSNFIKKISDDKEIRKSFAIELLSIVERGGKNNFLNLLLKRLNQNLDICKNKNFMRWVNEKIVRNDISWKNYALILVLNLLT
jgi:CRISPR-associated protein Cst1